MKAEYRVHISYGLYNVNCHVHRFFTDFQDLISFYVQFRKLFDNNEKKAFIKTCHIPVYIKEIYGISDCINTNILFEDNNIWKITMGSDGDNITKETKEILNKEYERWIRINIIDTILKKLG